MKDSLAPRNAAGCCLPSSLLDVRRPTSNSQRMVSQAQGSSSTSSLFLPSAGPTPSQATGSRAATLELSGSFDAAFSSYIKAAQAYLFLIRHTQDGEVKTRLRGVSSKLLERAERIKKARKVGPVMRDRMALGESLG